MTLLLIARVMCLNFVDSLCIRLFACVPVLLRSKCSDINCRKVSNLAIERVNDER